MAQFARPDSTVTAGGWGALGGPATLWECIDETASSDTDYCRRFSSGSFSSDRMEVGLSDVTDPVSSSGHIVRYRLSKSTTGGQAISWVIELRQGAAVIATWSHADSLFGSNAIQDFAQTLSGAQADAITNYADLRFSCAAAGTSATPTRNARLIWMEFEVPDAATPVTVNADVVDISVAGLAPVVSVSETETPDIPNIAVAGLDATVTVEVFITESPPVADVSVAGLDATVGTVSPADISVDVDVTDFSVGSFDATITTNSTVTIFALVPDISIHGLNAEVAAEAFFSGTIDADVADILIAGSPLLQDDALIDLSGPSISVALTLVEA